MIVTVIEGVVVCDWFVACSKPAAGIVNHPALSWVPCCADDADRLGLDLHDAEVQAGRNTYSLHR